MPLQKFKEKKGQRPVKPPVTVMVDASTPDNPDAEKEPLRFREPSTRDMPAVQEAMEKAKVFLPGLDSESAFAVGILATCYLPDDSETGLNPVQAFAELAADNEYAFDEVLEAVASEFPYFFDWLRKRILRLVQVSSKASTTTASSS